MLVDLNNRPNITLWGGFRGCVLIGVQCECAHVFEVISWRKGRVSEHVWVLQELLTQAGWGLC